MVRTSSPRLDTLRVSRKPQRPRTARSSQRAAAQPAATSNRNQGARRASSGPRASWGSLCDALASLCTGAWGRILVCALPHPAKVVIYDAKNHHCNGTQSQFVVRRDDCGRVKKEAFWPQLPGPTAWQGGAQTGRRKGLPDATSESHVSDQASAFSTLDIPGLLPLASSSAVDGDDEDASLNACLSHERPRQWQAPTSMRHLPPWRSAVRRGAADTPGLCEP
ncbi:hypothetical protein ACCO45_011401 [Purpureocillium lilacinum]|uniref:Uncharacterized protein n=1 Tax=Purpureocillium lilacinum TaxID=33203 RepID=A0ACC4DAP2_PURLI